MAAIPLGLGNQPYVPENHSAFPPKTAKNLKTLHKALQINANTRLIYAAAAYIETQNSPTATAVSF
jgi:hypothetical protein